MAAIRRFEDLEAWQLARDMVRTIYQLVRSSDIKHDALVRDQLTGAGISTMSNIAEGFGRVNDGDFLRFLAISRASGAEVQSLLYLCEDLS